MIYSLQKLNTGILYHIDNANAMINLKKRCLREKLMFREERMKKKITAVIAVLIALSALPACRAGGNEAGSTDGSSETESGEKYTAEYLPDKKYDGYAIRSLTIQDSKYIVLDIDSAEANSFRSYGREQQASARRSHPRRQSLILLLTTLYQELRI